MNSQQAQPVPLNRPISRIERLLDEIKNALADHSKTVDGLGEAFRLARGPSLPQPVNPGSQPCAPTPPQSFVAGELETILGAIRALTAQVNEIAATSEV